MPTFRLDPRSVRAVLLAGATSLALVATLATPARAAEPAAGEASAAAVGDFALGDGLEGLIDDQTGAFAVGFPVAGGATLEWDSRDAGVDRFGLGDGWRWRGIGFISVEGGVRVFPASGGQYEMDASSPTGLEGYAARDVAFARADDGELLAERADGRVAAQPYRFVLAELGGRRTYFRDDGVPVAMVDLHGNRTDFAWDDDRRLTRMVDELGVRTELTWQHGSVSVLASARTDQADAVTATVQLGSTGPLAVVDAVDRRTGLVYDPASGLLSRIDGSSGAVTQVTWQGLADGTTAVERVSVSAGDTGPELSGRSWQASAGAASGWPVVSAFDAAAGGGYETAVSDGVSTTRSIYTAERRLTSRALEVTTPSGAVVVQEQQLEYADGVPGTRPISAELVVSDTAGGSRAAANRFEYDDLGRPLEEVGADGAVTAWTYDEVERHVEPLPGGIQPPPAGLVVGERRTAADGLITETRHELDATGRSVAASEAFAGRTGEPLTRTGRVEYSVEPDGFVSAERRFPQGGAGDPVVTASTRHVDLEAGTVRLTETVEASPGVPAVTSTSLAGLLHGSPVETVDLLGNRSATEYDAVGRETRRTDAAGRSVETRYEERAEVVTAPNGVVETERVDALGRVIEISDNIADGRPVDGVVRVAEKREYPDPATVVVTDAWGASTRSERDVFGRVVRVVSPSGVSQVHEYDAVANTETSGLTATGSLADAEATSTRVLDEAGQAVEQRLDRADGGAPLVTTASFDGFGRQVAGADDVASSAVEFDALGNAVLGADGTAFTYNARNQVVEERVADERTQVAYWADGARRSLTAPVEGPGADAATEFYWDGADLVNDLHAVDTADGDWDTAGYLLGAGRHARIITDAGSADDAQAQAAYYVSDPLGSTTHLLGDDGSAVEAYAYTDYGAVRSDAVGAAATARHTGRAVGDVTRNPMRFAGELTDGSGRQYLRARMYDPASSRFISEDEAPQFSRYAYADLNPVRLADPSGRTPTEAVSWTVIGVGVVSAFIGVASVLATAATGGLVTLGVPSIFAAALGGLADVYSLFVATGQVLSNMRPEWVDDDLEAFLQSDEAVWSEALVGVAAVGAAVLSKTGYEAFRLHREIDYHKTSISNELQSLAERLGNHPLRTDSVRRRMSVALSRDGAVTLRRWRDIHYRTPSATAPTPPEGVQYVTIALGPDDGLSEILYEFHRARWASTAMSWGGESVSDFMLPMAGRIRLHLSHAFPELYGLDKYTPRVTFTNTKGQVIWSDKDILGSSAGWHEGVTLPPTPPKVQPDIIFLNKDGKPGIPGGEY
jgi:RHS repeat-associated protein